MSQLFHLEFDVHNTGDLAITDCLEPLTLLLPEGCKVIDAAVVDRRPASLAVSAEAVRPDTGSESVTFPFFLLNPGDRFRAKVLIDGTPTLEELKLVVRAENLASHQRFGPPNPSPDGNEDPDQAQTVAEGNPSDKVAAIVGLGLMSAAIYAFANYGPFILSIGQGLVTAEMLDSRGWVRDSQAAVQWAVSVVVLFGVFLGGYMVIEAIVGLVRATIRMPATLWRWAVTRPYAEWFRACVAAIEAFQRKSSGSGKS